MILNVGCGLNGSGDVNCDISRSGASEKLANIQEFGVPRKTLIDPSNIRNFVLCDCRALPFKSGVFDVVRSEHVIEHVPNPQKMLAEMVRCSGKEVVVICPHRWETLYQLRRGHHINFLNKHWFVAAAEKLGCFIRVYNSEYGLLAFPTEITAHLVKSHGEYKN